MVLDISSKYAWIVPLKTKTGLEVSKALQIMFKENKPKMLWVDEGKECYYKNVLDLLAKNDVKIYSTEKEEKSSVCQRWNRTIKKKCISNLLSKTTLFTLTFCQKYSLLITTANIDQ